MPQEPRLVPLDKSKEPQFVPLIEEKEAQLVPIKEEGSGALVPIEEPELEPIMTREEEVAEVGRVLQEQVGRLLPKSIAQKPLVSQAAKAMGAAPKVKAAAEPGLKMPLAKFWAAEARIGARNAAQGLTQALYQIRPYVTSAGRIPSLQDPAAMVEVGANVWARMTDIDYARKQDADTKKTIDRVRAWVDSGLGALPEEPLLRPVEGFADLTSLRRVSGAFLEQAPLVAVQMGAAAAHPAFGVALSVAIEGGGAREEQLNAEAAGGKPLTALERELIPNMVGVFNGALEAGTNKLQLNVLKKSKGLQKKLFTVTQSLIAEPLTESGQEFATTYAGKVSEFGGVPAYLRELEENGIDIETIKRVKQAFFGGLILSTVTGGTGLTHQLMTKEAEDGKLEKIVAEELKKIHERVGGAYTGSISEEVRNAIYLDAADLEGGPINVDAHIKSIENGTLPAYYAMPAPITEKIRAGSIPVTDEVSLVNAIYQGIDADRASFTPEQRSYIEGDARVKLNDAKVIGINFSTENMAKRWGTLNKLVAEEMRRRVEVLSMAGGDLSMVGTYDKKVKRGDMGPVEILETSKGIPESARQDIITQLSDLQQAIAGGTLTPEYVSKAIHDIYQGLNSNVLQSNIAGAVPPTSPIGKPTLTPFYDPDNHARNVIIRDHARTKQFQARRAELLAAAEARLRGQDDASVQTSFKVAFTQRDVKATGASLVEILRRGINPGSVLTYARDRLYAAIKSGNFNDIQFADNILQSFNTLQKNIGTPPPPATVNPGTAITGNGYDEQTIVWEEGNRYQVPFIHKLMGTVYYTRKHPQAQAHAQALVEADLKSNKETNNHYAVFDRILGEIKKKGRTQLRGAMDILATHVTARIDALRIENPKLHQAALELREWFDARREEIKQYKRIMLNLTLNANELQAFNAVVDGSMTSAEAARAYGVDHESLVDHVTDYMEVDTWGIDDYITNAMRGSWKLLDENGHVVKVAVTRKQLIKRGIEYLKQNPDVKTLQVDTGAPELDYQTPMSKRAYFTMRGKLGKALAADTEYISRKVADEIAKGALRRVVTIKPSKKWSPFLEKRKGVLEGEADLFDILYSYAHSVTKKINVDPIIHIVSQQIGQYPKNIQDALNSQIEALKGKYYLSDQIVDGIFKAIGSYGARSKYRPVALVAEKISGGAPFRASRVASNITAGIGRAKLAYRPAAYFVNRISGEQHVWVAVGTKYALRAKSWMDTPEGSAFLAEEEEIGSLGNTFTGQNASEKLPWYHSMYLFNKPESHMRRYGLAANYLVGRDMGMDEAQAKYHARKAMHFQLFLYNTAALPSMLRGPVGRVIGQFKPYFVQEVQFVRQLNRKQLFRYMVSMPIISGPRGLMIMAKSIPILGMIIGFDQLEKWMNQEWPRASRGIAGLIGGDLSGPFTWQFPRSIDELMGPFISETMKFITDVIYPMEEGSLRTAEHFGEWLGNLIVAYKNLSTVYDSVIDPEGWVKDSKGNPRYRPEAPWDLLLTAMGVTPISKSQQDVARRIFQREVAINRKFYVEEMNYLVKAVNEAEGLSALAVKLDNYIKGGGYFPQPIVDALAEHAARIGNLDEERLDRLVMYGLTDPNAIQAAIRRSKMPPQMRIIEEARLLDKMRALDAFDLEYGGGD